MEQHLPPKWPIRLLRFFLKAEYLEEIEGDMEEIFYENIEQYSPRKAKRRYNIEAILLLRPRLLKSLSHHHSINHYDMFKHNLTISFRTFLRHKTSFLINLTGLTIGLTCFILILLWVQDEKSVDQFHLKSDQLFQILVNGNTGESTYTTTNNSAAIGSALVEEMPEVLASVVARTKSINPRTLGIENQHLKADGLFASEDFFKLFSFRLLQGTPQQVLEKPNSIVISEDLATRLFEEPANALGQTIKLEQEYPLVVSGIFENIPGNSTLQFDYVLSFEAWAEENQWVYEWENAHPQVFLLLEESTNIEQFNKKIENYLDLKTEGEDSHKTPFIVKYSDLYLYGNFENGIQVGGRITYIWLFTLVAIFILLIACINFMNLSTAKASNRLKEISIKKTIGAGRNILILQYLSESFIISSFAMVIALLFVSLFLPEFNRITGKQLHLTWQSNVVYFLPFIIFFTGLVAGSYPAIYLSGLSPIQTFKDKLNKWWSALFIRKSLVVFQYCLSIILMLGVWVVYKQIEFTQNQSLGYDRENIIIFEKEGQLWHPEHMSTLYESVRKIPNVTAISTIDNTMLGSDYGTNSISWPGKDPADVSGFDVIQMDYGAIELLGMEMVEGRSFSTAYGADSATLIFNEMAIQHMGLDRPAIGQSVSWGDDYEIVGVVKDFHLESFHGNISPLVIYLGEYGRYVVIKLKQEGMQQTLTKIESIYQELNPGFSLDYTFLDDDYNSLYIAEQRILNLSKYFAGLAILISCMGLFGLAIFTAERRQKEIGIRKVLGASVYRLIRLISDEYSKMIGLAILIGLPISFVLAKAWLNTFAFSITLQWWYFIGVGVLALLIAWVTVSLQTLRVVRLNPVDSLKSD